MFIVLPVGDYRRTIGGPRLSARRIRFGDKCSSGPEPLSCCCRSFSHAIGAYRDQKSQLCSLWSMAIVSLLCLAFFVVPAYGQTGAFWVAVRDAETGEPLVGATVTLSSIQGSIRATAELTDDDGVVEFPVLKTGSGYVIQVSMPGFATQRQAGRGLLCFRRLLRRVDSFLRGMME